MKSLFRYIVIQIVFLIALESCQEDTDNGSVEVKDTTKLDTVALDSSLIYPNCVPEDSSKDAFGCHNMFFFKPLITDSIYITVTIDPEMVNVTNKCQEFRLPKDGILITYEVSKGHVDSVYFYYCDDFFQLHYAEPSKYPIEAGVLNISSDIDSVLMSSKGFYIKSMLMDARVVHESEVIGFDTVIFNHIWQGYP